jgi:uncharacterized membrane protein YhfC
MEIVAQQVSWLSIIFMTVTIIICFLYPIAIYVYASKRYHTRLLPVVIGASIFILFGVILKAVGTGILLLIPGFKETADNIPVLKAFIAAVLAGVFEETGRFVAFKLLNKKNKCEDIGTAFAYGAGHGGIEAIVIVGIAMLNSLLLAMTINFAGANSMTAGLEGETLKSVVDGVNQLTQSNCLIFLTSGFERFVAMSFHVAASVLVFMAVMNKKRFYLYPLAIGLHTILNIPAGLYQVGILPNIYVVEGIIFILATLVCGFTYFQSKKMHESEEL